MPACTHPWLARGTHPGAAQEGVCPPQLSSQLSHSPSASKRLPTATLSVDPPLTSPLLHLGCGSGSWDTRVVAQCFLCLCSGVSQSAPTPLKNYLQLCIKFWQGSRNSSHPALHQAWPLLCKGHPMQPGGASPTLEGWWETCGAAPRPSRHPLTWGGSSTACTEARQEPCLGQAGARRGVSTTGELRPFCSLPRRGFWKFGVLGTGTAQAPLAAGHHPTFPCTEWFMQSRGPQQG